MFYLEQSWCLSSILFPPLKWILKLNVTFIFLQMPRKNISYITTTKYATKIWGNPVDKRKIHINTWLLNQNTITQVDFLLHILIKKILSCFQFSEQNTFIGSDNIQLIVNSCQLFETIYILNKYSFSYPVDIYLINLVLKNGYIKI